MNIYWYKMRSQPNKSFKSLTMANQLLLCVVVAMVAVAAAQMPTFPPIPGPGARTTTTTTRQPDRPAAAESTTTSRYSSTTGQPGECGDPCECGRNRYSNERIVGGGPIKDAEVPWRVAMYEVSDSDPTKATYFCGGTIISCRVIMTAAHCTKEYAKQGSTKRIYVLAGYTDRTNIGVDQMILAEKILVHEKYDKGNATMDNDISLLFLQRPLVYSDRIRPSCLPFAFRNSEFENENATSAGWGSTKPIGQMGQMQEYMRSAMIRIMTTAVCKTRVGPPPSFVVGDNQICGNEDQKGASCQGDSGGSFDFNSLIQKRSYTIGIVSWGVGCGLQGLPGVYTKVTRYLDWIVDNVNQNVGGQTFCGQSEQGYNTTTTTFTSTSTTARTRPF